MSSDIEHLIGLLAERDITAKQIREIVPLEDWLENPFYCGDDGLQIYDYWKQEMLDFHNSGKSEWILFGSLGSGKTTAAIYTLIRKVYELSCYEPIPYLYNLMSSTILYFIYFSVFAESLSVRSEDEDPFENEALWEEIG